MKHQHVTEEQLRSWLRLVHTKGLGPVMAHRLLAAMGSVDDIEHASAATLRKAGTPDKIIRALQSDETHTRIETDLDWLSQADDRHIIALHHPAYPPLLAQIANPPLVLYLRGDPEVLLTPQIAIVGSRKPTRYGTRNAEQLAAALAGYGITVTSGMAYGVDAAAHQGALAADGLTVAVTGTGLDRVYPAAHHALAHEIIEAGALVSEFPIGTNPRPAFFPRRNRIISGLCYGTLIVEAALKSGSLTTAGHATEQAREVFAIPGTIDNHLSRGCHALLRNGATLVESAEDILQQIAPLLPSSLTTATGDAANTAATAKPDLSAVSNEAAGFYSTFESEPLSVDLIVEQTGMDTATVMRLALELELAGLIESVSGGKFLKS